MIFDSLKEVGGQPRALYPFKKIYDIPVFAEITGASLIAQLLDNAQDKTTFALNHRVTAVSKVNGGFVVDDQYQTKSIIVATGTGSFTPKKFPLKLDAESAKRVHYLIRNPEKFAHQTIGVFGGGDSALDWALELAEQPNTQIKLIHRRNEFRGLETSAQKLKSLKNVEVLTPYLPKSLAISDNHLDVDLKKMGDAAVAHRRLDQVVVA
ncbi:NAD(P)/FAD-dependent oxidoreductase, partial [Lactobacillus sp. XV13L]|nr:NAD(P)/FAD-dependent oxidoreductase [Lactobacillus sp. XV13L]